MSGLARTYRALGPLRFGLIALGLVAWIALGVWLRGLTGWPASYGYHFHGRGSWVVDLIHSPELLGHGAAADALFLHLWALPLAVVGIVLWITLRRRDGGAL